MNKQKCSAHTFLIVGMILALIGVVCFVFWQNFMRKDPVVTNVDAVKSKTNEPKKVAEQSDSKIYQTEAYSFEYPSNKWRVDEEAYNVENPNDITPVARTDNYKAAMGLGIDSGAYVAIYVNNADQSLSEMKENVQKNQGQIENLKDLTVGGENAFTYSSGYEGMRYHTIFLHKGLSYNLVYQYEGNDESVYMEGYKTIVSSFKFK